MSIDKNNKFQDESSIHQGVEDAVSVRDVSSVFSVTESGAGRLLHSLQMHEIELEQQNSELRHAREELELLHERLVSRAAELESANFELEAFSYTVSHDLCNPLAVISSYCQLIQEKLSDSFDKESLGFFREICAGTVRMRQLINALHDFSSANRCDILHFSVDLTKIVREIVKGIKLSHPEYRVKFRIAGGVRVMGDEVLLRVVMDNLLGNAVNYSGHGAETVIEFGVTEIEGKQVCYVRDNGPGFDMAIAEKLFIPFERFSRTGVHGSGIGLATVERIIKRHGGRVWAECKYGKGATFLFTLN